MKLDDGLKALLESGKEKGYLTYSQVNDYLPDDAVNPEKLDQLLHAARRAGHRADRRGRGRGARGRPRPAPRERRASRGELRPDASSTTRTAAASTTRCACTSPRWARSRCSTREQEIALAKKIEVTRKRFRRKVLECDYALRAGGRDPQARPHAATCRSTARSRSR